jgi:hypothetical protein
MSALKDVRQYPYLIPQSDKPGISLEDNVPELYRKFIFTLKKRKYIAVDSHADFYRILLNTPMKERNYYEIIRNGRQKLHFDIDMKRKEIPDPKFFTLEYAESVKDNLIKGIHEFFSSYVKEPLFINNDVIVFTSHGPDRLSYHIIIDNFAFPGPMHCNDITLKIVNNLPDDMKRFIDISVNKSNQQFRMWKSCKEDETSQRFKEIAQDWAFFGKPIHWEPRRNNDPRWSWPDLNPYLLGLLYFERTLVSHFTIPPIEVCYQLPSVSTSHKVFTEEIGDINLQHLEKLVPHGWIIGQSNDNFVKLNRTHPSVCPLCERIHEKDTQNYLVVIGGPQNVFFKCFRTTPDTSKQSLYLGCLNPDYEYTVEEKQQISQFINKKPIASNHHYCEEHVKSVHPISGTILLICSYLGTGKTTAFIEYIRRTNPRRVLILSPRQLYARSITSEYNCTKSHLPPPVGEPFKCYLDVEDVTKCNRLVLQMESLHKLSDLDNAKPFDVLILDEIEALLKQFSSTKTMKDVIGCSNVFWKLVRETPIIIGGDAFLSKKSINTLKAINPQVSVIRNDFPPPKRKAIVYKSWHALVHRALTSLRMGKKIVFVLGSKKKARSFAAECAARGYTYKIYTGLSENVEQDRLDLANVKEAWAHVQCLIYTSTITVGVNFDTRDVFDELFAYGTSHGGTVRDLFQGLLRVRFIKDNVLHVSWYSKPTNTTLPTTRQTVQDLILFKIHHKLELAKATSIERGHTILTIIDDSSKFNHNKEVEHMIVGTWQFSPEWLQICQIENILEDNLNKTKYYFVFEKFLSRCNYTVTYTPKAKEYEPIEVDDTVHYNKIPDINKEVYRDLQFKIKSGLATRMDHKMVDKYMFNRMIRVDLDVKTRHLYFSQYSNDKRTFFNMYAEKYQSIGSMLNKEINTKYIEFSSDNPNKLSIIQRLNKIFNIEHSCQGFTYVRQTDGVILLPYLNSLLPEIEAFFQVTSTAKTPLINICKRVEKVYELWTGLTKNKDQSRKRIDGRQLYIHTIKFDPKKELWEALAPWTEEKEAVIHQSGPILEILPSVNEPVIEIMNNNLSLLLTNRPIACGM